MKLANLTDQMDRLYEFDREPVTPDKFQSPWRFAGLFAGEYVAAPGAFVVAEHFLFPKLGIKRYRAEQGKRSFDPVATLM